MTDENGQELDFKIAGQEVRTKGYRLIDLIWLPLVLGVAYIALTVYNHNAEARDEKAVIAQTLKESNAATASALRESNANTAEAIRAMSIEQKKSTSVLIEMTCLLDPAMKGRQDARDFCKRMSRDR